MDEHDRYSHLFTGGTPPFWLFDYQLQSLFSVVELAQTRAKAEPRLYSDVLARARDVALIGAVGYFEAFCKHQFAALVNIHPPLLETFAAKRAQAAVKLSRLTSLFGRFDTEIGFLVAEQYDFGGSRAINQLFRDILDVTPLSHDEGDDFERILNVRHLLVHHAGLYTYEYLQGKALPQKPAVRPFRDDIQLDTKQFHDYEERLGMLGVKVATVTTKALYENTDELREVAPDRRGAVGLLLAGVWDVIGELPEGD